MLQLMFQQNYGPAMDSGSIRAATFQLQDIVNDAEQHAVAERDLAGPSLLQL